MNTPALWQAIDKVGRAGATPAAWGREWGGDFAIGQAVLQRTTRLAEHLRDPENPALWLDVIPWGEDGCLAVSAEEEAHREGFEVAREELQIHTPDWAKISSVLAPALSFLPLPKPEGEGSLRRIGFASRKGAPVQQVYLFIPSGHFGDAMDFTLQLGRLRDARVLVPTVRWLTDGIVALARVVNVEFLVLADVFAAPVTEPWTVASQRPRQAHRSRPLAAILAAQPDWQWEHLRVRLTDNGTLIATYGRQRGQHRFEKRGDHFPQHFRTLVRLAWDGEWSNPRSGADDHERVRKRFARLRETITRLIPIPNEPFLFEDGVWTPAFQLELDGALERALVTRGARDAQEDDPTDGENE